MSQSCYLKSWLDLVTFGGGGLGGGNLKSWKTLRLEGSGWNLLGKISTSSRYVSDVTRTDLLCLGEWGGRVNSEKLEKWGIFNSRKGDQILMKFYIQKDHVLQSSYLKSRPDPVTLGGIWGGNRKSWKTWKSRYLYLTNGWSDLSETWYIERSYVSMLNF